MTQIESSTLNPQDLKTSTVATSSVFISASRKDYGWRDRLKRELDRLPDQIEWWDDSKIKPGSNWKKEIDAAIERADVAVVLLSGAYLSSTTATSELTELARQAEFRGLKLFPIILEECPWKQYTFLREVQIWNGAQPIGDLSDDDGDIELRKIAKSILGLARTDRAPQPKSDQSPQAQTSDLAPKIDATDTEFRFSPAARAVLERAWSLAEKSGRTSVTSSCLLFAIADPHFRPTETTLFVRSLLNRNGGYEAALETFLKDGDKSRPSAVAVQGLPFTFSHNGRTLLERAHDIARLVDNASQEIHTRHLFAALVVTSGADHPLTARERLKSLGFDLLALCAEFREHLRIHASADNSAEWDDILGISKLPASEDNRQIKTGVEQPQSDSRAIPYEITYSAFIPDRAAYGRVGNVPLDDSLGVGVYAGHLAQLIAAKDTFMPLSIGLFGAWGAGKSHFIDLLDEQLRELTKKPGHAFYEQIVQIRFNAWHYLDTNLWANLVSEIFDQLFAKLDKRNDTTTEQVDHLKKKLAAQSALAAEARGALETAENARKEAEKQLRTAMQERAIEEGKIGTLLDDLKNLVIDDDVRKQLRAAADGLGLPKLESSFAELEARAEEVRSLSGRTKALVLAVFTGPGWWMRALLLAVALAAPLGVAALAAYGMPWMKDVLAGAGRTIAQVVAATAALSAWLASQVKAGNAVVGKLECAYDKVKKVRAEREAKDDAGLAQEALAAKRQVEEEARHKVREAEEKMKAISADLAEMATGRQLIRFLKRRASAEDYRQHLGLVSLVRRDFEQLSNLLTETQGAEQAQLPKIDRIVLYIDDLDRCRADRVIEVLEAVHLLLAFPLFAVVVAVDPRWLRQSLLDHYPRLLGGVDDAMNSPKRMLGQPATPQDYLEKIFQVPFNLQPIEKTGFEALVSHLFPIKETASKDVQAPSAPIAPLHGETATDVPPSEAPGSPDPEGPANTAEQHPTDGVAETVPEEKRQTPPDPQRLTLTKKEVEDVKGLQFLFQTPRAVKRLANTYSLIRVGVDKDEWNDFLGHKGTPGVYRVPLLLLAVASAFPALARPWLLWLKETPPTRWQLDDEKVKALAARHKDTTDGSDWDRLATCLDHLNLDDWPAPQPKPLTEWVPRVARYSF